MELRFFFLLLFLALAAVWDLALHRIPRTLLWLWFFLGFGLSPGIPYLGRCLLILCLLYPLWLLHMFGGADVRLLAVLGGWLGFRQAFLCFFYALLLAGVWGLMRLWRQRSLGLRLRYLWAYLRCGDLGRGEPYRGPGREAAELPFAAAVFVGVCLFLLIQK